MRYPATLQCICIYIYYIGGTTHRLDLEVHGVCVFLHTRFFKYAYLKLDVHRRALH